MPTVLESGRASTMDRVARSRAASQKPCAVRLELRLGDDFAFHDGEMRGPDGGSSGERGGASRAPPNSAGEFGFARTFSRTPGARRPSPPLPSTSSA